MFKSVKHILVLTTAACVISACGYRAALHQSYIPEVTDSTMYPGVRPEYQQLAALMEKDTGIPPSTGNTVGFIPDGDHKLQLMLQDLKAANQAIYMDYYRICADSAGVIVLDILKEKAMAGLDVRVMVDKAAETAYNLKALKKLPESGVLFNSFYKPVWVIDGLVPPAGTHRDHRKILMMDGTTAYLGGRNIQDKYFTSWRDADVRITGPVIEHIATVYMENQLRLNPQAQPLLINPNLQEAAANDNMDGLQQFYGKTVQVVHDSPTDKKLPARNLFEWAIGHAQKYFWVYSPYTPPPKSTLKALREAAQRGVDVRWIVQGVSDVFMEEYIAEYLYKDLLEAGVRIFEWNSGIMHAKQFMSDDYLMAIGSINMDNLSFFLNYEDEAVIYDEDLTKHAAARFLADLTDHCSEVSLEEVKRWNIFRRFRNWFFYVFGGPVG
jgi:cardiolipin synthase